MTRKIKYYNDPDNPRRYIEVDADEEFADKFQEFQREEWRRDKVERAERERTVSISASKYAGEDDNELQDFIICPRSAEPLAGLLSGEQTAADTKALKKGFAALSDGQRRIIALKFCQCKNDADIGRLLGITKQAVQNRVKKILDKLRKFF